MKKLPTKQIVITIQSGEQQHFVGPMKRLQALLTLMREFNFRPVDVNSSQSAPWRKVLKNKIDQYGEPALALRGARVKEGYSQVALAEKLNISQSNLSKMELGKRPIGKKMAQRLSKILNIDYRVFL